MQFEHKIIDGVKVDLHRFIIRLRSPSIHNHVAALAECSRETAKHATYCFVMTGSTPMAVKLLAKSKQLTEEQAGHIIENVKLAFEDTLCAS